MLVVLIAILATAVLGQWLTEAFPGQAASCTNARCYVTCRHPLCCKASYICCHFHFSIAQVVLSWPNLLLELSTCPRGWGEMCSESTGSW